jgi:hypothetical protein
MANTDTTENPAARPPLGLPSGSVRALLTLLIIAVVIVETLRDHKLVDLWSETLLIALAHYFTSRRFVGLSADTLRRLEEDGQIPRESNPLYLPRHTIRAMIVLAFAGLAYHTFGVRQLRSLESIPPILITVISYLLGVFARGIWNWRKRKQTEQPSRLWEDLKALVVLLAMLGTAIPFFLDHGEMVPSQMLNVTLALVLFYFGSR